MADYKIELGVHVKTNEIREQISKYNTNSNNAKLKLGIKLDTNDLKKQINSLNLGSTSGSKGITIPVNTQSLETSLKEVKGIIADIKASMGTLDGGDMKSLLSSVNQIATALGKAENESDNLVKSLNALRKKDFSVNFGFNMGKSASQVSSEQGDLKRNAISQLKQQAKALEDYLDQYYKVAQQGAGVAKLTQGTKLFGDYWEMSPNIGNTKNSLKQQVDTYKQYIGLIQQAAKLKGVDISGVTSGFSKSTDDIVKGTTNAANGIEEVKQAFKGLFGSGVDGEKLSGQLDSIVADLKEVKIILGDLSSGTSLGGLTQSFDRLSDSIEKLVQNATQVKNVLGDSLNTSVSDDGTKKAIQEQKELSQTSTQSANAVVQTEERKQQAYRETADAAEQVSKIKIGNTELNALSLKDDIDEADRLAAALSKLKSIQRGIDNIELGRIDTTKGIQDIQTLEQQLESLSREYNETVAEIRDMGGVSATQLQSFENDIDTTNRKLEQLQSNLRKRIQTAIDTTVARDVQKAHSEMDKLSDASDELRQKLQVLDNIQIELETEKEHGDVQKLSELYTRYLDVLKQVNAQLDMQKRAENDTHRNSSFELDKERAMHRLKSLFTDNSEAARKFGSELDRLQRELDECGDTKGLQRINKEITNLDARVREANVKTQTFGDKLKKQFSQYSSYLSVATLFMYAEQALRSMFEQVKLIDSAMTELKKVTNETDEAYNKFLTNAATRSREIGTTIDGLVSSTADFARLGYGFEDAQGLAEVANIYAVVGDEIEGVEGATESLISTMAAFKGEMNGMSNSDFAMSIIDKFNEIGELIA